MVKLFVFAGMLSVTETLLAVAVAVELMTVIVYCRMSPAFTPPPFRSVQVFVEVARLGVCTVVVSVTS